MMSLTIKGRLTFNFNASVYSLSLSTINHRLARMAQKQATRTNQAITLKGSTAMVSEFFEYSVNSILYQRGVYPSDDFRYAGPFQNQRGIS
jgi:hypothetical protein